MPVVCRSCARVNPAEARYCYYDGVALPGQGQQQAPVAVGAQPFHSPFVFPSGRTCHSFDELYQACDAEWDEARELLRQGYLGQFLGGLGRADLAQAARQATQVFGANDPDRALDQFLGLLPVSTREAARLAVHPMEVNLGRLTRADDRRFVLHLENQGRGLLHGSAACEDTPWLLLGDAPGTPQKVFQTHHELTLGVQVHGKALRAGNQPLQGQIVLESNGGNALVIVRAEVPVQPFSEGVLAGARSPRQIAERARDHPREAAALFEAGAVARWYEANGWTYPVQAPASSGLGAVQQFFEALGLVTPPRVEISERSVQLQGPPGSTLDHMLQVHTVEKRPVWAHASSTAPWLEAGPVALGSRTARIPLRVPSVPNAPGQRLQGKVHVTANGNQRFTVEVVLTISSAAGRRTTRSSSGPVLDTIRVSTQEVLDAGSTRLPAGVSSFPTAETLPLPPSPEEDRAEVPPAVSASPASAVSLTKKGPVLSTRPQPMPIRRSGNRLLKHLVPLGVILLGLLGVVVHDLLVPAEEVVEEQAREEPGPALVDPNPLIALRFQDGDKGPRVPLPAPTMCFGLVMLQEKDPGDPSKLKRLTWDEWGRTNNTCVRVDDHDFLFGHEDLEFQDYRAVQAEDRVAEWVQMKGELPPDETGRQRDGLRSVWRLVGSKVQVTQVAEIVPGPQSGRLDTCLVRYILENKDTVVHDVGLRFLLDTFIGANDGVPFTIPGASGLCDTMMSFDRPDQVPDYIQALENNDLLHPGTVAHLQFRVGGGLEAPGRVLLGGYPNSPLKQLGYAKANAWFTGWDVPKVSMRELYNHRMDIEKRPGMLLEPDSAVTLYWEVQALAPGSRREVGFSYGLGQVASGEGQGKLLLTVPNTIPPDSAFTLTALVSNPVPGEKVTLTLPGQGGFRLLAGSAEQDVPPVPAGSARPISPVTWHIQSGKVGRYTVRVLSSTGASQKQQLRVSRPPSTRGVLD